ncbi:hypothetical protein ACLKA7_004612 [Drosophila subpalustris]
MSYRWLIILTLSLLLLLMHSWDAEGACRRESSGRRMQMDEDDSSEDAIGNAVQQRFIPLLMVAAAVITAGAVAEASG